MRKILWSLLSMIIMLSSCSNDQDLTTSTNQTQKSSVDNHFYGVKTPSGATTKGVAQKDKLWYNGTTIKVKFLNGTEDYKQKVQTYVQEWEQYANIKFDFVENEKAQVRIGFDWNDQRYITWSYTGTDCKFEGNQNEATMSFAYWDSSSEDEIKGDVLRAFGQVLGLELEHRHLEFDPGWTNKIDEYWEGEIEDAMWEDLKEYVFDVLDATNIIQTREYDVNSIMVWPFSKKYAKNTARDFNYELSDSDIEFIKQVYPKVEKEPIVSMIIKNASNHGFFIESTSEIVIDWGDGTIETIRISQESNLISHSYNNEKDYTTKIYGENTALVSLVFGQGSPVTYLDISKNTNLKRLTCPLLYLPELNVSKNVNLEYLDCSNSQLTSLDLTSNAKLKHLSCSSNNISELDLSNNVDLKYINCGVSPLVKLDLSKNVNLESLGTGVDLLTELDVSKNLNLKSLSCSESQLSELDLSQNIYLEYLYCNKNQIKKLDVSKNVNLIVLNCHDNQLIDLDVFNNRNLKVIYCYNNSFLLLQESAIAFANSLPNNSNGSLYIGGSENINYNDINAICTPKGWNLQ